MDATRVWRVLAPPWQQMTRLSRWLWSVVVLLWLLAGATAWLADNGDGRRLVPAVFLGLVIALVWGVQIFSLQAQNHPVAARLVPGHVHLLRQTALGLWLAISAVMGGLIWACLAQPLESLSLWWLVGAAGSAALATLMRFWVLWIFVWIVPPLLPAIGAHALIQPLWRAGVQLWQAHPWSMLGAALLLLGYGLWHLFSDGDAAHVARHRRMERLRRAQQATAQGQRQGFAVFGAWGEVLDRPFERLPARWLAHVLKRATATPASVMARAEVVLHGQHHWLRHAQGVMFALALVLLVFVVVLSLIPHEMPDFWKSGAFGMSIGLCSALLNPGFMLPQSLWQTRREQALLHLLPGMPRGRSLNQAIAWRQARQIGVAWLLVMAALWALSAKTDQPILALGIGALPVLVWRLWPVPARLTAPTVWTGVLPVVLYMALALTCFLLMRAWAWPGLALMAGSFALSLVIGVWRWRRLSAAPTALPAGRLG